MALLRLSLFLLASPGALSQSLKSCGGPNDHFKNPVFKVTPDPPTKRKSLTIEVSGTLDEVMSEVNCHADLQIKALGIITKDLKEQVPMSISPGIVAGPLSVTVGPFKMPSNIPGSAVVKGQVHIVNGKNEPIMCIDMDLNVPAASNEVSLPPQLEPPEPVTSCAQPTDHIHDLAFSTSNGVSTLTGTLDEDITKASIDIDLKLKKFFVPIPIKMNIPIAITPAFPKGAIKATAGPSVPLPGVHAKTTNVGLTGDVKVNDGNGQEMTCLHIDTVIPMMDTANSIIV